MNNFKRLIEQELSEVRKLMVKEIPLGIKGIDPKIIPRADVMGGIKAMEYFKKAGISPLTNPHYKLNLINGELTVVLSQRGRTAIKVRSEKNPKYAEQVTKVFKQTFKDYFENL